MWQILTERGPGIAIWCVAMAAQVSGYNNTAIALALIGLAAFVTVAPICHHVHAWHKSRNPTGRILIPFLIGGVALAGAILVAVAIVGAVAYRNGEFSTQRVEIVVKPPESPPQSNLQQPTTSPTPKQILGELNQDTASRMLRYLALIETLPTIIKLRDSYERSGKKMLEAMKPGSNSLMPRSITMDYRDSPTMIRDLANKLYDNYEFDLVSAPKILENPHLTAPGDEAFPDQGKAFPYRKTYYLIENVLTQMDKLIGLMNSDIAELKRRSLNDPNIRKVTQ
jgi:hypothetical protein